MIRDDIEDYLDSIGLNLLSEANKWSSLIIDAYPFLDSVSIYNTVFQIVLASASDSISFKNKYSESILSSIFSFASILQKAVEHGSE